MPAPCGSGYSKKLRRSIRKSRRNTCMWMRLRCRWCAIREDLMSSSPRTSMFEPVHGSAPPIAGKNIANPFGAILTAAMMLAHLGMSSEAHKIESAALEAVRQKKTTSDIGGTLGTREAGEWVAQKVAAQ